MEAELRKTSSSSLLLSVCLTKTGGHHGHLFRLPLVILLIVVLLLNGCASTSLLSRFVCDSEDEDVYGACVDHLTESYYGWLDSMVKDLHEPRTGTNACFGVINKAGGEAEVRDKFRNPAWLIAAHIHERGFYSLKPAYSAKVLDDFVNRNRHIGEVRARPKSGVRVIHLSEEQRDDPYRGLHVNDLRGRQRIQRHLGFTNGYLTFSRIGYSDKGDEAMVAILHLDSLDSGGWGRGGQVFLLRKTEKGWAVEHDEIIVN